MRRYFLSIVIVCCCFDLFGQLRTISGYVRDQTNGESLIGATAFDKRQKKGTVTNNFGFYSITTPYDSAVITFSFVGYDAQTIAVPMRHDTSMVVLLRTEKFLEEVIVTGTRAETINESTRMGSVILPPSQVKAIPAFAGEVDVLKAMQLLPGVSGGAEGSSNLIIRGGNPEQTLVLMDGATIYNPTHLYGLFSAFNPDAVNNIELVKGGFPARYGGRLSGVADITLKEGNMNKFGGEASLGLIASRFVIEGPIQKNKTSFIVSGRRGYMNFLKSAIQKRLGSGGLTNGYYFYDLNAKINHRFNSTNRIYASIYTGYDHATSGYSYSRADSIESRYIRQTSAENNQINWRNTVGSIRWNHEINKKLFFNVSGTYTHYNLVIARSMSHRQEIQPGNNIIDYVASYNYTSGIRDLGLKIDFDFIPNTNHYIRFGASAVQHHFTPGIGARSSNDPNFVVTPTFVESDPKESSAYIEDDWSLSQKTKINFGVHAVAYRADTKTYYGAQPRFSLRHSITPNLSVKTSYAYMQQYVHMVTNAGLGMPTDLWVPVTDNVKPQMSHQVALGLARAIGKSIEVSLEGYYKTMENLVEYKEGATYMNTDVSWDNKIEQGHGKAYGAELFIQKKTGRLTGWFGYTLSWNKRQFDNINHGEWFYYRYDHRHDVKATANYKFSSKFDVSATWLFATGNAVTVGLDKIAYSPYDGPGPDFNTMAAPPFYYRVAYEARNNFRMQSYHRLDISANYTRKLGRFEHKITVGAYNIYDRRNPFYLQLESIDNKPVLRSISMFPILPSVNYAIKF